MEINKGLLQSLCDDNMVSLIIVKLISSDTLIDEKTCDESLSIIEKLEKELDNVIASDEKKGECKRLFSSAKEICIRDKKIFQNEINKRQHK
jgi:predicted nucleotidyltransferase